MGCQRLEVDDGLGSTAPGDESAASSGSSGSGYDDSDTTASMSAPDLEATIPGCTGEPPEVEVRPDTHASCGGVACACAEVCVISEEYCRDGGWYEPPARCVVLPPACAQTEGAQAQGCLTDMLCEGGLWIQEWRADGGVLSCGNPGQDCWSDTDGMI
jgi:hypothetical protein